jgi:hypothetical protein
MLAPCDFRHAGGVSGVQGLEKPAAPPVVAPTADTVCRSVVPQGPVARQRAPWLGERRELRRATSRRRTAPRDPVDQPLALMSQTPVSRWQIPKALPVSEEVALERVVAERLRVFARAAERGEVPADLDVEVALDLIYGAVYHRLLHGHAKLTDRFARDVVELALNGTLTAPQGDAR